MSNVRILEKGGKRYALVPLRAYRGLVDDAEMLEDIRAYDASKREDNGFRVPADVVDAMLDGASSVRAWRLHRDLTQQLLADAAGIAKPFLSQIETGKRVPSVVTLRALAKALHVPLDALD